MENKNIDTSNSGIDQEFSKMIITRERNIEDKFNFLKLRFDEASVLVEFLPESSQIIKSLLKNIYILMGEIKKDAKDKYPEIILEIPYLENDLNEISKRLI